MVRRVAQHVRVATVSILNFFNPGKRAGGDVPAAAPGGELAPMASVHRVPAGQLALLLHRHLRQSLPAGHQHGGAVGVVARLADLDRRADGYARGSSRE